MEARGAEVVVNPLGILLGIAGIESALARYLDLTSFIRLTRTSKSIHGLFFNPQNTQRQVLLNALMSYLAHLIVNEPTPINMENIRKILCVFPELLKQKIKRVVFVQTGQAYIDYSLLQLAYAEGNDDLCQSVLVPCFETALGKVPGHLEIRNQLNEKFPAENEDANQHPLEQLLAPAIQAISHEQFVQAQADGKFILTPATLMAITTAGEAFDALQPKEIRTGCRFSTNIIPEIFYHYVKAREQGWAYDFQRCPLFEDGIITRALAYMPIYDVMKGCLGWNYLDWPYPDPDFKFKGLLTMRRTPNINFHVYLHSSSREFVGIPGAYIDIIDGRTGSGWGLYRHDVKQGYLPKIQFYYQTKKDNLQLLRSEPLEDVARVRSLHPGR